MSKVINRIIESGRAFRVAVLCAITVLAVAAIAAPAAMAEGEVSITPMTEKAKTEFLGNLPTVLGVVGLIVAVGLVVAFARKHLKKA